MSAVSENLWPFKAVFSFGNRQKSHGTNLANMVDGPISVSIFFGPKTPGQRARHEQGHCHGPRSKHQAKVQVFSDEQPHVFPNNNAGSLFHHVQETQSKKCPCDKKNKNK
jgi:hypothetical protein